ncbi:bifunctional 2-polyprenyl-6-hydroxyphenol methylase/3-demethylubiquinol 3-O-methyltransferase UbiG [Gloeocapsopsis dulcis]|uniref:3-demethylubiquinone-9 3-O-methyltransferase n=1 Tax=Gloeocapsopsis dulcis AAB1 = 1H9 TaxID=1433147 RepID=A0A6N8G5N5_9CHRO|nr:bifunctional 2-polyprenyl-6-hydroxyphenol methylase/3-demethylubiquinol 3-O-methyltransferase UbiG [Gloeocapsopsis dulcis]MUL39475.1 3-demethylubiquinone-9 3-O-methyltransferase [Gloeocapsopsis dulcis AAB1 = 1H9]WNN90916.1 bifunctional 2-polyprenyl-6-hydroxyphenol methylase/3-demethylubiquinol 3-O-methyltransferase UbiG [Gloeocapsopsis dulcis]
MKKNNLEYYDLNSDKWWQECETLYLSAYLNNSRFEFFSNYVPSWKGIKVLDIGCGGGLACEFLAKQGANVIGIDLSLSSIEVAREHAKKSNLKIDYQAGAAEQLPYQENTFDIVLCFDVLEHVDDWQKVISEAHRVLQKNGLFLFDTINKTWQAKLVMIWLLEDILKQIPQGFHDWHKFIKPQAIHNVMKKHDFTDIVIKGFDLTGGTSFKTLKNLVFKGLNTHRESKAKLFEVQISDDTSIWYIGKAVKLI